MMNRGTMLAALFAAAAIGLLWMLPGWGVEERGPRVPAAASVRAASSSTDSLADTPLLATPGRNQPLERLVTEDAAIRGRAYLPDETPCGSGFVFAWPDGLVPQAEWFRDHQETRPEHPVCVAPIQSDGSFCLASLPAGKRFTLGAVARGALCVERLTGVSRGSTTANLRMRFTFGVAVRLEELGGRSLRTAPELFGEGPVASGPGGKLLENPPELQALGVLGLEAGHGTRYRWQYLAVSDTERAAIGPLDYTVEVPGYLPAKAAVFATRLLDRLDESVVALEPRTEAWGEIAVQVSGLPQVLPFALREDQLIGVVYLTEAEKDPIHFAVHANALGGGDRIPGVPVGAYSAYFEAVDAYYQTEVQPVVVGAAQDPIRFDCSEAGTLLIDVQEESRTHDRRFIAKIEDKDGAHFYVTFDSGPYLIPMMFAGTYRVTEAEVPGGVCSSSVAGLEVFPGRLSVELVQCRSPEER